MKSTFLVLAVLTVSLFSTNHVFAQYEAWGHHATLALLTDANGADLPASARVENFPVLIRLSRETFDFSQAKAEGADVRFSADRKPLSYQIEQWDADTGSASLWVRVPVIRGATRGELTMHWGKADAVSESKGQDVFNQSNGFSVVMHLNDAGNSLSDSVGNVVGTNHGTTSGTGVIGAARRFESGGGIACGEDLKRLPAGEGPFTTEAWLRAEKVNGTVIGWGNEQGQGKVVMQVRSPPGMRVDGYFSSGTVHGERRLPLSEWVHVVQVCEPGASRLFLNGRLDGATTEKGSPLNIRNPARMWLGGWYNNYNFVGDLDEVRISHVSRSVDWIKLCYENQKPNQTLVGTPMQTGSMFEVSPATVTIEEGKSFTVSARAGGADKVYWILRRDGDQETVVASDRFSFTADSGRVTRDTAWSLRFKAVYPTGVQIREVPVTIRNTIPEPAYSLQAPKKWNGRDTIEIVPQISNFSEMKAAGADELHYRWDISGGAVMKQVAADRLILRRSQSGGPIRVTSFVGNGGAETEAAVEIPVAEPASDPWVQRTPLTDEKPEEGQFYPRDDRNEGRLHYNGALDRPADKVFLKVFADDKLFRSETQKLTAERQYAFTVKLKPGLIKYRVELGAEIDGQEQVLQRVGDLVCGDAYLIDGQSNALATDTGEDSPRETNEWIRSYGGPTGRDDGVNWVRDHVNAADKAGLQRPNLWTRPVWKRNASEQQVELGWWGMELGKRLVASQKMPVCIIQAAIGGSRIDEHQPNPDNHTDLKTMYGRMMWRVEQARLTHGIRAVLWHQGENDQGADGPTGGFGWETNQQFFVEMSAAWKSDMPNIQHYYIFQIWPNACAMGGRDGSGDRLREVQRQLPRLYSRLSVMSTLGIKPPGGCHYPLEGWGELARLIQPLIERDIYGVSPTGSITPPNLRSARFTNEAKTEIILEFDQPVVWRAESAREFYLDDQSNQVESGRASGNTLTLRLKAPTTSRKITYLKERDWSQDRLLLGANGIAALTFCDVEIESSR